MMNAVEFVKTLGRMCNVECTKCEFWKRCSRVESCSVWQKTHPEEAVAIAEQWAKEHPVKTRQSEFLKQWPNARMVDNEWLNLCPKSVEQDYEPAESCDLAGCAQCRKEFWLAEVEE